MRKPIVAGNWKMHGSRAMATALARDIVAGTDSQEGVIIFPPFVYLSELVDIFSGTAVAVGAQNVSEQREGAYTGEIAASMLADLSCRYVLCGHSERRQLYAESDDVISEKVRVAQQAGLTPILCVGETLRQREAGNTMVVIAQQIQALLDKEDSINIFRHALVAYEPVWAIGTGLTASPEQAQEVHAFIRQHIASHNQQIADELRILYGGSVKASNATDLFAMPDVDGGLIGGASLKAEEFIEICNIAGLSCSK